jgi:hypothetical protein
MGESNFLIPTIGRIRGIAVSYMVCESVLNHKRSPHNAGSRQPCPIKRLLQWRECQTVFAAERFLQIRAAIIDFQATVAVLGWKR